MERRCRLSAAQADVSRRSVTCIRGTGASAIVPQVYPPPASSATAFNVLPGIGLESAYSDSRIELKPR